jgi:hypothetical protein
LEVQIAVVSQPPVAVAQLWIVRLPVMSIRAYKITTFSLVIIILWLAWKYWSLLGQVVTGAFVSHQAVHLRADIKNANEGAVYSKNVGALSDRDQILTDLSWYIDYFDHHTNTLARSPVLSFITIEREYVVRDAIAYLRRTGTNDFGDDPYQWLKHEFTN